MKACVSTLVLLVSFGVIGCSSDSDDDSDAISEEGPLYLLHSGISSPEGRTNYFTPLTSIDEGTKVDYGKAIEVPGIARLFGKQGIGWFAIGEGQTITRYDVSGDRIAPGDSVSFADYGVNQLYANNVFIDAEKAYYRDPDQLQLIIWNPAKMTVDKAVAIPDAGREGSVPVLSQPVLRGDQLIFAVGWAKSDYSAALPGAALVIVDSRTDEVRVVAEERCSYLGSAVTASNGDTYFFSSNMPIINAQVEGRGGGDCVLRLPADSDSFDPEFEASLGEYADGASLSVIARADGDRLLALVLDAGLLDPAKPIDYGSLFGAPAWRWAYVRFPALDRVDIEDAPPAAFNGGAYVVNGEVITSTPTINYSESTLFSRSGETPRELFTFGGFSLDLIRVR